MLNRLRIRLLLTLAALLTGAAALATVTLVSVADGTAAVTSGAHTINLGQSYTSIIVFTDSGAPAVNLNFNHGVTASTSDPPIPTGGTVAVGMAIPVPPTDQINYYSGSTAGNISWYAWRR